MNKEIKKRRATNLISSRVRRKIIKKEKCLFCKSNKFIDGHHQDYNYPLKVIWLCKSCHKKIHNLLKTYKG